MKLKNRKECLFTLRELGYEVGAGFMVGSPGQTVECLAEDFEFLQELKPHMIGIGPFLAHQDTPFGAEENGSYEQTLLLLSILRLDVSGGVTSCDDSTWNNCAGWTGAGIIGRSECINAKFITGFCAEKVRAV